MNALRTSTDNFGRKPIDMVPRREIQRDSLTLAVEEAIDQLGDRAFSSMLGPGFSVADTRRLLALLSWSYAREVYSSMEIHSALQRSGTDELWNMTVPDMEDIRRFRTQNRAALQSCLQAALHYLAKQKVAQGVVTKFNESYIAAEATRRIIVSIFVDSVESGARLAA